MSRSATGEWIFVAALREAASREDTGKWGENEGLPHADQKKWIWISWEEILKQFALAEEAPRGSHCYQVRNVAFHLQAGSEQCDWVMNLSTDKK